MFVVKDRKMNGKEFDTLMIQHCRTMIGSKETRSRRHRAAAEANQENGEPKREECLTTKLIETNDYEQKNDNNEEEYNYNFMTDIIANINTGKRPVK